MAGIFFGVVLVLLKEQADRSIQQPGDSLSIWASRSWG